MANELTNITLIPDTDNKYTLDKILGAMRDMADFSRTCIANRDWQHGDGVRLALNVARRSFFPPTLDNPSVQTREQNLLAFGELRPRLASAPEISGPLDILEWVVRNGPEIRASLAGQMSTEEINFYHDHIIKIASGLSPNFIRPGPSVLRRDKAPNRLG